MSFFVTKDSRWLECRDPSPAATITAQLRRHALAMCALVAAVVLWYVANLAAGVTHVATTSGTIVARGLAAPATIARDARGIPHVRAATTHDLFFGQGFAEASDRLFQMDLARRYAYGHLSEIFGARALTLDEQMRAVDISGITRRQWRGSDAGTQRALEAFTDGVNAALRTQPLPVEFRMLLYEPQPWTPYDSIAVAAMAALELSDSWRDVLARDDAWHKLGEACYAQAFPLSDPRYDVSIDGTRAPPTPAAATCTNDTVVALRTHPKVGSNAWAAGAAHTRDGGALIANDPHVDISIPGIWYVMELRAPGFHAAGATIPGLPGIALGHNDCIAWAATNAQVATTQVYRAQPHATAVLERFHVRLARDVYKTYYRTTSDYYVNDGDATIAVRWPVYRQQRTTITTLLALDTAKSIAEANRALASYSGAPENFIVADRTGAVAYHLAGLIPLDAAWGRYAHSLAELSTASRLIDFADLPHRDPSRSAILVSANNKMYGAGYRYRLSAAFEPPYRAARIAALLRARSRYDVSYFRAMQSDTFSPLDAEIARELGLHAAWNGRFDPDSRFASRMYDMRTTLASESGSLALFLHQLRDQTQRTTLQRSAGALIAGDRSYRRPWGERGAVDVEHPLSPMWYGFLRGRSLPGDGNDYTIRLQESGFAQGFRAVWDVRNWDAGGISIPAGESGEAGSPYYDDEADAWIRGTLEPLAFSNGAVARAIKQVLTLRPR